MSFTAVKRPDWNGKEVYHIHDASGHAATMTRNWWDHTFLCHWHRADQWSTRVQVWQRAIAKAQAQQPIT